MIAPRQINDSYYDFPHGKVMSTLMIASWQSNEYPNESFLAK